MKSCLAIAFVVSLAVMQVTSQGFNDMGRLIAMDKMGLDIPDTLFSYHMLRGFGFPSQLSSASVPMTSVGLPNTQRTLNMLRGRNVNLGPTTPSPVSSRAAQVDLSSFLSNLSSNRNTNTDTSFQHRINPLIMAHMLETASGTKPADASSATAAAQSARNRMLLQRLSRARSGSGAGGLFGGMNGILPFMMLSGAGGDSMRNLMMLKMFTGAGAGGAGGAAQGGMMGNMLPLMILSEGGLSF
ncbi:uncharacterized protein LOC133193848 [Saccostrea echinata]|uniref:uncharacterized protein LOC133193848 n=1 Tax=Saccostrea echinata TaxID=191078 RepID=UPI002A812FDC|nr:uncharacterized protein LOC133193848 [Saccostrea echinata]